MNEILPGVFHWTTLHEPIGANVSSYFIEPAGIVIDPKIPDGGLESAFEGRAQPQQVVMTTGLHDRDARAVAGAFGIGVRLPREGLERLGGDFDGEPYHDGDEVAPGVRAIQIGVLCPDEYSLHITGVDGGALTVADGLTRYGDELGFFSDSLLGDDPEAVKDGLRNRYRAQLERDFDALLFGHGEPIAHGAKAQLRRFLS
jgi:hypothetical protein